MKNKKNIYSWCIHKMNTPPRRSIRAARSVKRHPRRSHSKPRRSHRRYSGKGSKNPDPHKRLRR